LARPACRKWLALLNGGSSEITVSAVSISGDFAIPFNGCAHGIKPFTHCSVKVTFTPSQLGTATGTLSFVDSASNSPQTVSLNGSGSTTVPTQTKVTSSVNETMAGEPVTLTATVKSLGGGTIPDGDQFYFYGSYGAIGYARLQNGIATLTTTNIQGYAGKTTNTTIAAEFLGDANFSASTRYAPITVTKWEPSIALQATPNPSLLGQQVTFAVNVSSPGPKTPGGTVGFAVGNAPLTLIALNNGQASIELSFQTSGARKIRIFYEGDGFTLEDRDDGEQIVNSFPSTTTLTTTPNPSAYGQPVTLTANVTSSSPVAVTGNVTFRNGSTTGRAPNVSLVSGMATLKLNNLSAGENSITATYDGDPTSAPSTTTVSQTVNPAQIAMGLASSPNPSKYGQPVRFTVTLTSNGSLPEGQQVTFSSGAKTLGVAKIAAGKAILTINSLPVGTDTITATYPRGMNYSAASASSAQQVK
jgi:large repetitive protein